MSVGPDVHGINTNKIPAIQQAIDDWIKDIESAKLTDVSKYITNAIKGNVQEGKLKALCQSCDSYTKTLTSKLTTYKRRLDEVAANYKKNDANSTAFSDAISQIKKS